MPFHTDKEGGAILSLFSNGTNQGKTTALTAAASVWGDLQGLHLLNSSTLVARGLVWSALRNLPCIYDECTKTDPGILRQMVETFTTGHDKQRGKVDATLRHELNSWQMIMITGGNQSLVETLNYDKGSNAQAYRILELMPQLPVGLQGGDKIKRAFEQNYGWAGDYFLRFLVGTGRIASAVEEMHAAYAQIQLENQWSNDYRFWLRMLSAIKISMKVVREAGIMEFDDDRLFNWLVESCNGQMVGLENEKVTGGSNSALTSFINEEYGGILAVEYSYTETGPGFHQVADKTFGRPIVGRYERKTGTLYLSQQAFNRWLIKEGYSPKTIRKDLIEKKRMDAKPRVLALAAGTGYPSSKEPCLVVYGEEAAGNVVEVPVAKPIGR
jgi:hypothetical protein